MILRSYTLGLVPVAVMLVGFGLDTARAIAQTTYEFGTTYDTVVTIDNSFRPDDPLLYRVTVTGENPDAPYGLTNFISNTYGQLNPQTNVSTFNADPAVFGLQGEPILSDRYFGGNNELFGTADDMAVFDLEEGRVTGSGTITITGGEGIFENANGEITFTQNDRLTSLNIEEPFEGQATLNFSVETPQAVPEPRTTTTLGGLGVIGAGFLLRRQRRMSNVK